jgi:hypothetical protein
MKSLLVIVSLFVALIPATAADAPKLVITAKDVRQKSVAMVPGTTANSVMFYFTGKSPAEIKSYEFRFVKVMSEGKVIAETSIGANFVHSGAERVPSGLVLTFRTKAEAEAAMNALRSGQPKQSTPP